MNETKGKDYITATIVTATSILKFQRSFGPARTEKDALRILEHTALLVAIGFEIGDNFGDTHSVVLFVDEVTERAVSDGMIKEEESSSENLPFRKVGGLLAKGFVMAHENDPNLKAFEDFLKKLG